MGQAGIPYRASSGGEGVASPPTVLPRTLSGGSGFLAGWFGFLTHRLPLTPVLSYWPTPYKILKPTKTPREQ